MFNKHVSRIESDTDTSWQKIDEELFYSYGVFDKKSELDWNLADIVGHYMGANQSVANRIRIPDEELFQIETLELSKYSEMRFRTHGYNFVDDILSKLSQNFGKENILIIFEHDETAFQELMEKLIEHKHLK